MTDREVLNQALGAIARQSSLPAVTLQRGLQLLGQGRHTIAYSLQLSDHRTICLKIARDAEAVFNLRRASTFLGALEGPNFPRLLLDGSDQGFVVEEFVEGVAFCEAQRKYLLKHVCLVASELAQALEELTVRTAPIVHRDIKPAHLFLERGVVKLLDFGSAELEGSRMRDGAGRRQSGKLGAGTHVFQPLEQLCGDPSQDRRVDVFAAAGVLYAILEGRPPFDNRESREELAAKVYLTKEAEIAGRISCYPVRLRSALLEALRVDPDRRSQHLWDVARAVKAICP